VATASVGRYDERPDVRRTANTLFGPGLPKTGPRHLCSWSDGQWTPFCWLTLYKPMQDFRQCLTKAWTPNTKSWHESDASECTIAEQIVVVTMHASSLVV